MNLYSLALFTGLSFFFLVLVFRPLEVVFPAKPGQRFFRPAWFTDLCFFLGQYLLWSGLILWALVRFGDWLAGIVPERFRQAVAAQPWWLQAVEVVLLSDFFIYWGHRLQHRVGFLWRFHAVHHTAEHLDWLAAHREHPLDSIYSLGLINLPAFILGFPLETLAGFIAFRGIWAIYIHSNVRLPIGPLRMLLGARNSTTGTTTATATPAIMPTSRPSWISCLAPIAAPITNPNGLGSRNQLPGTT
jgi:sterol desaturase/sphingolipid hydroxylase (fatty acid hydroxylase superfamily)